MKNFLACFCFNIVLFPLYFFVGNFPQFDLKDVCTVCGVFFLFFGLLFGLFKLFLKTIKFVFLFCIV